MKKLSPFDILNSINNGTHEVFNGYQANEDGLNPDSPSKSYIPFVINRSLSYFHDTVLIANEMNQYASLAPKMQYDFLCGMIRPRKRFSKWAKKEDDSPLVLAIMFRYECSSTRAREIQSLLNKEQQESILASTSKGGKSINRSI